MNRRSAGTLAEVLMHAGSDAAPAVIEFVGGRQLSAADLLERATCTAGLLQANGVGPGDRVALMLDNTEEFLWALFGAAYVGAISVPLNTNLRGPILDAMLLDAEPSVVISESVHLPVIEASARTSVSAPAPRLIEVRSGSADCPFARAVDEAEPGAYEPTDASALAMIMYTSGTTGPSKGIMIPNGMSLNIAAQVEESLSYTPQDVIHTCLPMFHANALHIGVLPALRLGATAVVGERFSASGWWDEVRASGATAISLLGSMLPILWNQPPLEQDQDNDVRVALAIPAPTDHYDDFERRFGLQLASLYGMTDFGVAALTPPGGGRAGWAGVIHPDWECRVVDEQGQEVEGAQPGELLVRPRRDHITQLGYWRKPEATVEAWQNLWFHTADRAVMESDGWIRFVDRQKDSIRRSGENVSSYEVESVLIAHDDVVDVAVFGVAAELAEDEVMAAVVLDPGATTAPVELLRFCEEHLPYFAVPRFFDIRTALPRTATHKVRKDVLAEEGVTASTWDAGPRGRRAREKGRGEPQCPTQP